MAFHTMCQKRKADIESRRGLPCRVPDIIANRSADGVLPAEISGEAVLELLIERADEVIK
jgi:hypothetical protein